MSARALRDEGAVTTSVAACTREASCVPVKVKVRQEDPCAVFRQAMLGHELLSTTEICTKVAIRKLQEVHAETHPSAKMERKIHDDDNSDEGR